jgi:hypothetical protein
MLHDRRDEIDIVAQPLDLEASSAAICLSIASSRVGAT